MVAFLKNSIILFSILILSIFNSYAIVNLDIPLPTSLANSFGSFKTNTSISLVQECTNDTAHCDICNLTSLKYPDGSIIVANIAMDKHLSLFNYTLDGSLTNINGKYTITGFCTAGGIYSPWAYNFEVTTTGKEPVNGLTTVAFMLLFMLVLSATLITFVNIILTFANFNTDFLDVIYAWITYFGILTIYYFNLNYFGDIMIDNMMSMFVYIFIFTHILVPLVALLVSIFVQKFRSQFKTKKGGGDMYA